jgi:signal transduction histidine kinase
MPALPKITFLAAALFLNLQGRTQDSETDSLLKVVAQTNDDSLKVNTLIKLASLNAEPSPDSALRFATEAKELAIKTGSRTGTAFAYKWIGISNNNLGNYYDALVNSNNSLNIFETLGDRVGMSNLLNNIGAFYADKGEDLLAVQYYLRALDLAEQSGSKLRIESTLGNIGVLYAKNSETLDNALQYYFKALSYALEIKAAESIEILYTNIGEAYAEKKDFQSARHYYQLSLDAFGNSYSAIYTYNSLGKLFLKKRDYDSANIYFDLAYSQAQKNKSPIDEAQSLTGKGQLQFNLGNTKLAIKLLEKAMTIARAANATPELKEIYKSLSDAYGASNEYTKAFAVQNLLSQVYNSDNQKKLSFNTATLQYNLELQKQSGQVAVLKQKNASQELSLLKEKLEKNISISGLALFLVFSVILLINIRQRRKLNRQLSVQKTEIEIQKMSVENALIELKSAQAQLIQSEKMASLGELTAGIAHEIQNPLNFVNNFSDVNKDLLSEMKDELEKGNLEEAKSIANNVIDNEEKINFHGQRADSIVKGMLQHSRASTGQKEPTNINALADEYLRIAYHGLRARDKSFNASIKTDFDQNIGTINIAAQDIGRVLLNLYNNAFYVVSAKKKQVLDGYEPTVNVTTKKLNGKVVISVKDNGNGIPQKVIDKIFQPFFTTKPAGQGTGLGLSLSYDVIKAHGGEIKVNTREGEGTEFIIQLPMNKTPT